MVVISCLKEDEFLMAFLQRAGVPNNELKCPLIYLVTPQMCTMRIDGKESVFAEPDRVSVILGVQTENMQLEAAQSENTQRITSVIAAIISLGVNRNDIRTQTYQIQPQYDYVNGEQVFRGYRVVHELKVEIDNARDVGKIIDVAVRAGANEVSNISFYVSKPQQYYEMALNMAIGNAISKAESIGRRINVYVNPTPIKITEKALQDITPLPYVSMQAASGTTPVQPGLIEITAQIESTFAYACNIYGRCFEQRF